MSTHTPAPWIAKAMSRNGYLESARVIFDNADNEICRIEYEAMPTGSEGIKRSDENGALIAAAPDLLAALEAVTFIAESVAHLRGLEAEILPHTDAARAAIAKARGQA